MFLYSLVLAAGKGTRMKSTLPKTLHLVAGQPMVAYVLEAIASLKLQEVYVVVGHKADLVKKSIDHKKLKFIVQKKQRGTGHAVIQAKKFLAKVKGDLLVLNGDVPLITAETLKALIETHKESNAAATVLTAIMPEPAGYGRIIRGSKGTVVQIVEQKDASPEQLLIQEINTGTYCFNIRRLFEALKELKPNNVQKEYYLTDVIGIMKKKRLPVYGCQATNYKETLGINTREDLAEVTKIIYQRVNQKLMRNGVSLIDPETTYIDATVSIGRDTVIYPGTLIKGATTIGSNCTVGPNSEISDSQIGQNVAVKNSEISRSIVEDEASVSYSVVTDSRIKKGEKTRPFSFISQKR